MNKASEEKLLTAIGDVSSDLNEFRGEFIEFRAEVRTELPHLARKEDVTNKIERHAQQCSAARDSLTSRVKRTDKKTAGALIGAVMALTAVIYALLQLIPG